MLDYLKQWLSFQSRAMAILTASLVPAERFRADAVRQQRPDLVEIVCKSVVCHSAMAPKCASEVLARPAQSSPD
jgi:hypothetical protein